MLTAVVLTAAGCSGTPLDTTSPSTTSLGTESASSASAVLEAPSMNPGADVLAAVKHRSWLIGSLAVCLSAPGTLRVTKVASGAGGDVAITAYGLRPNPFPAGGEMVGSWPTDVPLEPTAVLSSSLPLTSQCSGPQAQVYELVVTVTAGTTSSYTPSIDVTYQGEAGTGVLTLDHGIRLCLDAAVPECGSVLATAK